MSSILTTPTITHRSSSPVKDTGLPCRKRRFNSDTMLHNSHAPVVQFGRTRRFGRRGYGFESCQEFHFYASGIVESWQHANLSTLIEFKSLSLFLCARRQVAKAPDCKSGIVSSSLIARSKFHAASNRYLAAPSPLPIQETEVCYVRTQSTSRHASITPRLVSSRGHRATFG